MSKRSGSSQPGKRPKAKSAPTYKELERELATLAKLEDEDIDMTGLAENLEWTAASIGKFYRPIKQPVSMRIDADILNWARSLGKGYQSQVNELLRIWMYECLSAKRKNVPKDDHQTMKLAVKAFLEHREKERSTGVKSAKKGLKKSNHKPSTSTC
ncbi:MAG: BrnA antitoxin family protein [Candidatus Obscuribacterales bacterium]|nr:BrnA antitoxin family protein [Candidatus Obscuribacterales bacterium]